MLKILKTAFIRAKNPVFKSNVVSMVMQDLAGKFKGYIKDLESKQEVYLHVSVKHVVDLSTRDFLFFFLISDRFGLTQFS